MSTMIKEYKGSRVSVRVFEKDEDVYTIETSTKGGEWVLFVNTLGTSEFHRKHTVMTAARKLKA